MIKKPEIIYQDSEILVLEKPAGLVTTSAVSVKSTTLQDWLKSYLNLKDSGVGGRAGIVHRLDKDTSGIILVAKNLQSFNSLQKQFKERKVKKRYLALVHGLGKSDNFEVNLLLTRHKFGKFGVQSIGKTASTAFRVLKKFEFYNKFEIILEKFPKNWQRYFEKQARFYSLIEAVPATGRTHQIRVHLKSAHFPIVSDSLYAPRKLLKFDHQFCPRLFLHAEKISFSHPETGKLLNFESKLPNDLVKALQYLQDLQETNSLKEMN